VVKVDLVPDLCLESFDNLKIRPLIRVFSVIFIKAGKLKGLFG
jgi:hypothetical protein